MNSFLFLDDKDVSFIWDTIQSQRMIFHPKIAPDGIIDFQKFYASKRKKPFVLFLDRNILISLLKFCEKGSLQNKGESQLIGLIMAWAELNNISISAGLAIQERASQLHSQTEGLIELRKFQEAFDAYPGQLWLYVAEGRLTEVPPITYSLQQAQNITAEYSDGGDHYDMAVASLLHAVRLYRNNSMSPVEKIQEFLQWTFDNLLVGEYMLIYIILLFTEQEGIKAPKHVNSNHVDKIIAGCENQAWDIAYLTNWSTMYSDTENYAEEFLFATNDTLLKQIFIYRNRPYGVNALLFQVLSRSDYTEIIGYIDQKMRNRIKPDFGDNPRIYFQKLIESEKQQLSELLSNTEA